MIRKSLVVLLVLFFVLSGVSWGIERVEKESRYPGLAFHVQGGWTSLDKPNSGDFFCLGGGASGRFSKHFVGRLNVGYYHYIYTDYRRTTRWNLKIIEYSLSLKLNFIDIDRAPVLNPYIGSGMSLLHTFSSRVDYSYSNRERKDVIMFAGLMLFLGCDFNLTNRQFLFLEGCYVAETNLAAEYFPLGVVDSWNNWRIFIGFGHRL